MNKGRPVSYLAGGIDFLDHKLSVNSKTNFDISMLSVNLRDTIRVYIYSSFILALSPSVPSGQDPPWAANLIGNYRKGHAVKFKVREKRSPDDMLGTTHGSYYYLSIGEPALKLRRERDSNPRISFTRLPVFKTGAINHSTIPPKRITGNKTAPKLADGK